MSATAALDRTIRLVRDVVSDNVTDDAIVSAFQSLRVRCVSDTENISTHSGQTVLVTLVSLIARMGVQVSLDLPDIEMVGAQPPLRGTHLRTALVEFGSDLVPGSLVSSNPDVAVDLAVVLGDTPTAPDLVGWRVTGTAWSGTFEQIGGLGSRWDATWPIGGMTAAALVVPEIFKAVLRKLPARGPVSEELLAPCQAATWDFGDVGTQTPVEPLTLDIISAGAITQSSLYALMRLPLPLRGRLFDDDVADLSNLNRQMLLRRSDSGSKVEIVAGRVTPTYSCVPVLDRFDRKTSNRYLPLSPHVLVGVDNIPTRWDVQRATKGWVGVGATSHFEIHVSSHEPSQACAGCLHPHDDPQPDALVPTVCFVSFWAGLSLAVRLLRKIAGSPYPSDQQHLCFWPLRMDSRNAALWRPVAPRLDCPTGCNASRRLRD